MAGNSQNRRKFSWLRAIALILALGVFLYSGFQMWKYFGENRENEAQQQELIDQAVVILPQNTEPEYSDETEEATDPAVDATEPFGDPPPIYVDFATLKAQNEGIVAWIYCEGTPINYPIVQAADNSHYLNRTYTHQYNANGSIFMDFRNLPDFGDRNTLVYGHNMTSGAMFGTLKRYAKQDYFEEHPVMWILTAEKAYRVDLIVGMVTPYDSEAYKFYNTDEALLEYLQSVAETSTFDPGEVDLSKVKQIVTLSTCSYEYANARYVVIGSMVEVLYPEAPVPEETAQP